MDLICRNIILGPALISLLLFILSSASFAQDLSGCTDLYTFSQAQVDDGNGTDVDIVIIEFEDIPNRNNLGDWQFKSSNLLKNNGDSFDDEFNGDGYLFYNGSDFFQDGGNSLIEYSVNITSPGVYRFVYASAIGLMNVPGTEHNDAWVKFPDADAFYGYKAASNSVAIPNDQGVNPENPDPDDPVLKSTYPDATYKVPEGSNVRNNGFLKVFMNQLEGWWYEGGTSDNEGHFVYVRFDSPGLYTMQISGRSNGFAIDRAVLWKEDGSFAGLNNRNTRKEAFISLTSTTPECSKIPLNFSASKRSATSVALSWRDNSNSEAGYEVQVSESQDFSAILNTITVSADVSETVVEELSESRTYFFRVRTKFSDTDSEFAEVVSATTNTMPLLSEDIEVDVSGSDFVVFPEKLFRDVFSDADGESAKKLKILSLPRGIRNFEVGFDFKIEEPMEFDLDLITNFRGEDILRYRANNGLTGTTSFEFTISDGFDFAETSRKVIINVLKPQFEASYKGVLLNDRVRFDLKDVPVGASLPITFQIENVGTSSLRLRDLPLQVTNNNIDQYEILQQPDKSVLEPGETTEFIVAFQPTSTGNKNNARIILLNSDFDSNDKDFRIDLFGRGVNDETAPAFLSDPEVSVAENLKSVYQIETNEWVTFSLGSEKDESFFELESNTIDTLKKLSFVTPPDFENPNDGNQDNVYQLDVSATDLAGLSTMFELTVTVTDVANEGIVITSPSMISVDENVTGSIYVATANVPATFSLGNSKDESLFSIVNAEISFNSSPNFEDPLDVDTNNIYLLDLIARANDGSTAVTELAVAVNDVEEVISSTRQWLENSEKEWILPNPATYTFSLNGFERAEYQQVSIYDFSGKELISYKDLSSNSFDISSLDQGVYLVIAAGLNDILPLGRLIKK